MKKSLITIFAISILIFSGCVGPDLNTFDHPQFLLALPGSYNKEKADKGYFIPDEKDSFPEITWNVWNAERDLTEEGLLALEESRFKGLCEQTNTCGSIIKNEKVVTDGKIGIKFTVQYKGRSLEDKNGFLNEYYYVIYNGDLNKESILRFWTSATDQENPEQVSKTFDEIISKISIKQI